MRSLQVSLIIASLLLLLNSEAHAQDKLILYPLPGKQEWRKITSKYNEERSLEEWIPANQKIDEYKEILIAQSSPLNSEETAASRLEAMFAASRLRCDGSFATPPRVQIEDGYSAAYAQIFCGHEHGKNTGAVIFAKALEGSKSLFIVQMEFRIPSSTNPKDFAGPNNSNPEAHILINKLIETGNYFTNKVKICGERSKGLHCVGR